MDLNSTYSILITINKSLLIHGYGIGRTAPLFFKRFAEDGGFSIFSAHIKDRKAEVFFWDIEKKYSFLQSINPFENFNLYKSEKQKASSPELLSTLHQTFNKNMPDTVICHSLGCYLFLQYINKYSLPNTVKKIIFIQGDISSKSVINNHALQMLIKKRPVIVINTYCPWDYNLWGSAILNQYLPIGLGRVLLQGINNKLLPVGILNAHTNGIRKSSQVLDLIDN